jgi:hypothetical protein
MSWLWGGKPPPAIGPAELEQIRVRTDRVMRVLYNTVDLLVRLFRLETTRVPIDASDKETIRFVMNFKVDGRLDKFRITVYTKRNTDAHVFDEISIHPAVVISTYGVKPKVMFTLAIYEDVKNKTIIPYLIKEIANVSEKAPDALVNAVSLIVVGWLPIVRVFEGLPGWTHNIEISMTKETQEYRMNVKSEKNGQVSFDFPRYIEIRNMILGDDRMSVKFTYLQGFNDGRVVRPAQQLTVPTLKETFNTYLTTAKWTKYGSMYEVQYQRVLRLVGGS